MNSNASLIDSYGRKINYLRISLTDQCNFRCLYCMPPEGLPTLPKNHLMTDDAIVRFVTVAASLGIERIRLTGGEPLLRPGLPSLVRRLAKIAGISDIGLTTNGSGLLSLAEDLRDAGIDRLNVSLDSLDPDKFRKITLSPLFPQVISGINETIRLGIPLKINVVVLRGMNDDEILDFVRLAVNESVNVRFIEFMPLCGTGWRPELVYPLTEVKRLVRSHFRLAEEDRGDHVAESFLIQEGRRKGRVGFIATLSEPFCDSCSRIRLTADGTIRPCLFSNEEFAVRPMLNSDGSDEDVASVIRLAVKNKSRGSKFADSWRDGKVVNMSAYVGSEAETPKIRSLGG